MVFQLQWKWLCAVWIKVPPNLPSNLQKIKIRATEPNLCFLCSPQCSWGAELSARNTVRVWKKGAREGEQRWGRDVQWKYEKEVKGERKMDAEPYCECCLRMFIKPESWPETKLSLSGRGEQEVSAENEKENEENPPQPDGATGQETASSVLRCAFAVIKKKLAKDAYADVINNVRKTADPVLRPVPKISWRPGNGINEPERQN